MREKETGKYKVRMEGGGCMHAASIVRVPLVKMGQSFPILAFKLRWQKQKQNPKTFLTFLHHCQLLLMKQYLINTSWEILQLDFKNSYVSQWLEKSAIRSRRILEDYPRNCHHSPKWMFFFCKSYIHFLK